MHPYLPFFLLPSLVACVGVESNRKVISERATLTHCRPGRPVAALDSAGARDRIQLVLSQVEECTDTIETVTGVETSRRLATPVRGTLAVLAGIGVGLPLLALAVVVTPQASDSNSNRALGDAMGSLVVVPAIAAGGAVWAGLGTTTASTWSDERTETKDRPAKPRRHRILEGTITVAGLGPRPLMHGRLELTLAEAIALEGKLSLNGRPIELLGESADQLHYLVACQQALEDGSPFQERMAQATKCDQHGWGFADPVLRRAALVMPAASSLKAPR